MGKNVAEIRDLNWSYRDKPLFTNLSATFPSEAFISIVGPNGSGKTTLLRHFLKILPPPKGAILLEEGDLLAYPQRDLAKYISYVPQQSRLEYDFTVYECVAMGRYAHEKRLASLSQNDHALIKEALEVMNLSSLSTRLATELSGGEYQRVLIARALAQQSRLILLDEPVSNLDLHHQREILTLLKSLVNQKVATVVCVLHDLNTVSAFSDLVIMMDRGEIVAEGSVKEVLTKERIEEVYHVAVELLYPPGREQPLVIPKWN
ncbi:MAG: ABC transporter ATP-binding protein [Sphaerochaetaceae bacterium]|jgi:iron complex transport system ATP-binding protein|nr:ABC transporter ATP-binding protein [Sphaerochaetaceae bacterium]HHU88839.1 ABC transporter ATP-binding protein [Spirochaetales bacterium]